MEKTSKAWINIEQGKIKYSFEILYHDSIGEECKNNSYYIPAFNMFFSAPNHDAASKRAIVMTKTFFDYFLKTQGVRTFILQLHALGFRAAHNHDLTINRLITRKINTAKFKSSSDYVPDSFRNSKSKVQESEFAMA